MTEQEERISESIRKAAAAMGVSESDLRAYTEGILEGAETRVQELEGERDRLLMTEQSIDAETLLRAEAAESRLARLEEALERIEAQPTDDPASILVANQIARDALTPSTPPTSEHRISPQSVSGSSGEPND